MPKSFAGKVLYNGKQLHAAILLEVRKDGKYFEINIDGFPRFHMSWSPLGRYDITGYEGPAIPYELILGVSDTIEQLYGKKPKSR